MFKPKVILRSFLGHSLVEDGFQSSYFSRMKLMDIIFGLYTNSLSTTHLFLERLDEVQCHMLARSLVHNTSLHTLIIQCLAVNQVGMAILIEQLASLPHLASLALIGCLNDDLITLFTHHLQMNRTLRYLDISGNSITDQGMHALSDLLTNSSSLVIHALNLSYNELTSNSCNPLTQILISNDRLNELFLDFNRLNDEGIYSLLYGLIYNYTLHTLSLQGTGLTDMSAGNIGFVLKNQQNLTILDLSYNTIKDAGVACLAEGLASHPSLLTLKLNYNKITAKGAQALGKALCQNTQLIYLELVDNQVNNEGLLALAQMLMCNHSLRHLDLGDNLITEECIVFFTQQWIDNYIFLRLDFSNDNLSQAFIYVVTQLINQCAPVQNMHAFFRTYESALEDYLCQQTVLKQQLASMLKGARLIIQSRKTPECLLQRLPLEVQEHIVSMLLSKPIPYWQRRNIWQYAKKKPRLGITRHDFLRYAFFKNKPFYPLSINVSTEADDQQMKASIGR
jgi:Ran GTPase-activating protein (RanGAP) involved in mRNA processing and transport